MTTATTTLAARPTLAADPDKAGATPDRAGCPAGFHGTRWAISAHGCTCPDARLAQLRYNKRHRAGTQPPLLVPAIGSRRRLEALQAIGWSVAALNDRLGLPHGATRLRAGVQQVHHDTAARIATLYRELADTPAPDTLQARRLRSIAARKGWARPDQWVPGEMDDPAARSDLDYQRNGYEPLAYEDVAWLDANWPLVAVGERDRDQQAAARDERIAADLSRSLGRTITVEAVQTCRRRGGRAMGKLSDDDVRTIRDRYVRETRSGGRAAITATRAALCAAYDLTPPSLTHVLSGRTRPYWSLPDLIADSPQRRVGARDRGRAERVAARNARTARIAS